MIIKSLFLVLWFFLPAGIANATPIFAARLPLLKYWKTPLDGGRMFRGKPIFGKNKTWRGLVCGMVIATLVLWLEQYSVLHNNWIMQMTDSISYASLPTVILGPLFGLGALAGDAIESFFKRQYGVAPGESWFPFDQLDYVIGGAIAAAVVVRLSFFEYILLGFVWFGMHIAVSYVGYLLKLKDKAI